MEKKYNCYFSWISKNLIEDNFLLAFIFGSVARELKNPNDCDLLLVTIFTTGSKEWQLIRENNEMIKAEFFETFNLKLSIQLFTVNEYNEQSYFIRLTMQSPKIIIIDKLQIK